MANLAQVMKDEIRRLARKEVRIVKAATGKDIARLRKANASLRARVGVLEKSARQLTKTVSAIPTPEVSAKPGATSKQRILGKGVRSLRKRLKLTRAEFGLLANATAQSVYNWEKQDGVLTVRGRSRDALLSLRGIGLKDARRKLAETPKKTVAKKATKKRVAKKAAPKKTAKRPAVRKVAKKKVTKKAAKKK